MEEFIQILFKCGEHLANRLPCRVQRFEINGEFVREQIEWRPNVRAPNRSRPLVANASSVSWDSLAKKFQMLLLVSWPTNIGIKWVRLMLHNFTLRISR